MIAEGAQMEGDVVAEELTIGGYVKGTIHANRVTLNSTAVTAIQSTVWRKRYRPLAQGDRRSFRSLFDTWTVSISSRLRPRLADDQPQDFKPAAFAS